MLNKLNLNGKKKQNSIKSESTPKAKQPEPKVIRPSSPKRAQNSSPNVFKTDIPIGKPLPKVEATPNVNNGSLKQINIDPHYSLDGKNKKPSGKKLKEIESFLNSKTVTYQNPRDEMDENPNPIGTIQDIMNRDKDKEMKNMHNNISRVSVRDINNILFKNRSPQRERQYDETARRITVRKQEIERKRTMTNKQQQQKLINEIKKREFENAKLRQRLDTIKDSNQPNNSGKSNSILILERKKQELINQQRKEMDKILKKQSDIHKITNRKKEIELIRSIETEKRKLIKLKLEEENLSKLQYHRELNELKPLNREIIKDNTYTAIERKIVTSPKIIPNLDNIDRVIIDKTPQKHKTKKRVRFNLDNNQNYIYIKDNAVIPIEKTAGNEGVKPLSEVLPVSETEPLKKPKTIKRLKCNKDKSTSDLFSDSIVIQPEYTYYCGLKIFGFDNYRDDYNDIKKFPDKDMKRAIKFDYKFKYLDDLAQFDYDNNMVSRKKINIIPILYNILTNMNITLYKKRKF